MGSLFGFGIPCSFLPCVIIAFSSGSSNPKNILITNCILLLIKTGLFIGFFISLYSFNKDDILLIAIIPEVAFDFLVIINDSSKLNKQNNNNQNNN